jgi:GTP cyclohydrolase II
MCGCGCGDVFGVKMCDCHALSRLDAAGRLINKNELKIVAEMRTEADKGNYFSDLTIKNV